MHKNQSKYIVHILFEISPEISVKLAKQSTWDEVGYKSTDVNNDNIPSATVI